MVETEDTEGEDDIRQDNISQFSLAETEQNGFFLNTFIVHIHVLYSVVGSQITVFPHPQPYLSSHSPLS